MWIQDYCELSLIWQSFWLILVLTKAWLPQTWHVVKVLKEEEKNLKICCQTLLTRLKAGVAPCQCIYHLVGVLIRVGLLMHVYLLM